MPLLILPWNLRDEIVDMAYIREWGAICGADP
jgi:hypothetical protein